ncbi:MAG: hypothetical protein EA420_00980 [Candidatus Competibacteraceae bacterium]|nr:MAG: hypothetical protein EA420_00980 [Candidatus Competibacteraceae bacterium]
MHTNDVGNDAVESVGPMDSSAASQVGSFVALTASAIARVWRGQKQLRQRVLTPNAVRRPSHALSSKPPTTTTGVVMQTRRSPA